MTKSAPRRWFEMALRLGAHLAALAVVLIMLVTIADLTRRGLFGRSIRGGLELTELLLVGAVWLGLGDAERQGMHVRTNVVTRRIPHQVRRLVRTVGLAVMGVFLMLLAWASSNRAIESTRTGEYEFGLAQFPIWPSRLILMAGALLILIQALLELVDMIRGRGFLPDADLEDLDDQLVPEMQDPTTDEEA